MACPKCIVDPFSHSFHFFGKADDKSLFYTALARMTCADDYINLGYLCLHLNEVRSKGPWIWVIDCTNMEIHHNFTTKFVLAFAEIFLEEHADTIQGVLILNPNRWFYEVIQAVCARFGVEFIHQLYYTTNSGLLNSCINLNFTVDAISWLMTAINVDPNRALEKVDATA